MTKQLYIPDPFKHGPQPLLTEKDRGAVDRLVDQLRDNLITTLTTRIPAGADPLFKRGYRAEEIVVHGFGPEIIVEPLRKIAWYRLLVRRIMAWIHLYKLSSRRDYRNMHIEDYDTERLIEGLHLLEDPDQENLTHVSRRG